jgi:carbonic anhydrase
VDNGEGKRVTRIIQGVLKFQSRVFGAKRELFTELGKGQHPLALFITCSDSRINPNLLTQTEPGELFILRNAGNLVPTGGQGTSGEAATIEYAVAHLRVRDIILCGHSKCGAMQGLLAPEALKELPRVADWIAHAKEVLPQVERLGRGCSEADRLNLAIERNVAVQLEHLKSHPAVAEALAERRVRLHGWVYHLETGEVLTYDQRLDQFVSLDGSPRQKWLVPCEGERARDRAGATM